ncbi:hypothetical protein [Burkholderia territorii]|uniref:hypothetical protein n=1 Tax=Burkholderia territorii TaxID=1503055 RepID=UPI000752ACA2|nr:hypothetical protein [Burkholderia territorii]KWE37352.1 hypothetical protein WT49_10990 [Burkholderia territorii]KWE38392.1 hypothetical protein WT50_19845 [Burkholderia territorii]KWE40272.1 hypothetical protein WT51_27745 [Burkholderia territorii]
MNEQQATPLMNEGQMMHHVLTQQRNELADRLAHASVAAGQAEQQVQALAAANATLQSALDEANAALEATKNALVASQSRADQLQKNLDDANRKLAAQQRPIEGASTSVDPMPV